MTIEELQQQVLELQDKNNELEAKFNETNKKNQELNDDNKRLMDYNNKLFMRIGTQVNEEKPQAKTDEEIEKEEMTSIIDLVKGVNND